MGGLGSGVHGDSLLNNWGAKLWYLGCVKEIGVGKGRMCEENKNTN